MYSTFFLVFAITDKLVPNLYFDEKENVIKNVFTRRISSFLTTKEEYVYYNNVVEKHGKVFGISRKVYKQYKHENSYVNESYMYSVSKNEFLYLIPQNVSILEYVKK